MSGESHPYQTFLMCRRRAKQSQKAGDAMILWTQRTSVTRCGKVRGEIAVSAVGRPAWPSRSFFILLISPAILWMVSNRNTEADPSSAAISKFSSKSYCSNANLYKLKIWLVGSLLLETCIYEIFSDSFLISSGHQKKYYKHPCTRVDKCTNQHGRQEAKQPTWS